MGHLEAAHLEYRLPDGRTLLGDVSFRGGEGAVVALVGPNGAGKTTLLRLLSGELKPHGGSVTVSGGLGVMRQFVGSVRYQAAQTRLRKFEEAGPPPEPPREQDIRMRLKGGRTGVRAVTCKGLELTGLMKPFDLEVFYGGRVAVFGSDGRVRETAEPVWDERRVERAR